MNYLIPSHIAAAFNAAGEAMLDLPMKADLARASYPAPGRKFIVTMPHPRRKHEYVFGYGDEPAEALRDGVSKYEAAELEAAKLVTAAEAIEAFKGIIAETIGDDTRGVETPEGVTPVANVSRRIYEKLDALPVAK